MPWRLRRSAPLAPNSPWPRPKKFPRSSEQPTKQAAQRKPAAHIVKRPVAHVVRNVPLPRKRPPLPAASAPTPKVAVAAMIPSSLAFQKLPLTSPAMFHPAERPPPASLQSRPPAQPRPDDIAAVKRVIEAARKGRLADADTIESGIGDPVARKLAEWIILRSDNTNPSFARYAAFVNANPGWPHAAAVPPPRRERAVERQSQRRRGARLFRQP